MREKEREGGKERGIKKKLGVCSRGKGEKGEAGRLRL